MKYIHLAMRDVGAEVSEKSVPSWHNILYTHSDSDQSGIATPIYDRYVSDFLKSTGNKEMND